MILKDKQQRSPEELSNELLRQIEVLRQHDQHVAALESRISAYERQFNLPSSQIHDAIDAGRLDESAEVCDWIMDVELLERARTRSTAR